MCTRKIKKSYISCTGYFASYKNKSQIAFESVLERDFYMILEFDNTVIEYKEQPMTITYEYLDGKKRRYTPDTLVTYKNGTKCLYEVKYQNEIDNNPELFEKIELLKHKLNDEYNIEFRTFTDNNINKIYLNNLKFLYKFAFLNTEEKLKIKINEILNSTSQISITNLLTKLEPNKLIQLELLPYVWKYVFDKKDIVNLSEKLTMESIFIRGK